MEFRTTKNATAVMALIPICCCIGFVYALYCYFFVSKVQIDPRSKMLSIYNMKIACAVACNVFYCMTII